MKGELKNETMRTVELSNGVIYSNCKTVKKIHETIIHES